MDTCHTGSNSSSICSREWAYNEPDDCTNSSRSVKVLCCEYSDDIMFPPATYMIPSIACSYSTISVYHRKSPLRFQHAQCSFILVTTGQGWTKYYSLTLKQIIAQKDTAPQRSA
jgi:hypothetical protein